MNNFVRLKNTKDRTSCIDLIDRYLFVSCPDTVLVELVSEKWLLVRPKTASSQFG